MQFLKSFLFSLILIGVLPLHADAPWWNASWSQRQKVALQLPKQNLAKQDQVVLIRLTDVGIFEQSREDGGDLRWIAADGKTILNHTLERFDPLLGEALLWLRVPTTDADTAEVYLYYGNPTAAAPADGQKTYPEHVVAAYHFADQAKPPQDATSHGHHATTTVPWSDAGLIGSALRINRNQALTLGNSPVLTWSPGGSLTVSLWFKVTNSEKRATLLTRGGGSDRVTLSLADGVPTLEVQSAGAGETQRAAGPITTGKWHHLAWVVEAGNSRLYLDGKPSDPRPISLPTLDGPISLSASESGWSGEIDALRIDRIALSESEIQFAFTNQGGTQSGISFSAAEASGSEGGGHVLEHLQLFGDIAGNMMFDGWIAIGVCVVMIVVGWSVAIRKFLYLNRIEKSNRWFLARWRKLSSNPFSLENVELNPGQTPEGEEHTAAEALEDSPLYHIYHLGSEEIRRRLHEPEKQHAGLSSRSIQAIRASLDSGLVEENHRLTHGLVYLTISIAGGPYVGLLGTVVGVMITFAIIAKSGEVNVNSIAPGIASALLATVVGLVVAIPALFIYSYLNSRIKTTVATMQVFIDEFVAKAAEYHPARHETPLANDFRI